MKASFRRIASATRNEKEVGDLHNDAYVLALEIGERRGRHIDFADPDDQDLIMRALYVENVKRGDWKMRRAVRIDQEPEDEDKGSRLAERLPAHASSDPLVCLIKREAAFDAEALLAASYSQASAYVATFRHFRHDLHRICKHLILSESGLYRRLSFAKETVQIQPSMFDRIERIPADFIPMAGRQYGVKIEESRKADQWAWDFESATCQRTGAGYGRSWNRVFPISAGKKSGLRRPRTLTGIHLLQRLVADGRDDVLV